MLVELLGLSVLVVSVIENIVSTYTDKLMRT